MERVGSGRKRGDEEGGKERQHEEEGEVFDVSWRCGVAVEELDDRGK